MVAVPLVRISLLYGPHEGHEFAGNNPIDVAIFDSLVVLVFLDVEGPEVVPLELDGVLEALEALEHGALIQAVALAGVPVRLEQTVVGTEHVPRLLGCAL